MQHDLPAIKVNEKRSVFRMPMMNDLSQATLGRDSRRVSSIPVSSMPRDVLKLRSSSIIPIQKDSISEEQKGSNVVVQQVVPPSPLISQH